MRRYRGLLSILYKDHATNVKVRRKIQEASDDFDKLMTLVKKRKLMWFVHVSMSSCLAKTILQGTLKDKRKGIQKRRWGDNLKVEEAWTFASSIRAAETVQGGKGLLQIHMSCPEDLRR